MSYLFSGHFDTGIGPKIQTDSYVRIATALDLAPAEILFFSDNPPEFDAAMSAGLRVVQVLREGAIGGGAFSSITSFAQVELETAP